MKQERRSKAESISQKLISEFIINELQELTVSHGIITVTKVEISNDSSYIDIHVSCLLNHDELTKSLSDHAHPIHRMLGKKIAFIKVPKIRFRYDSSWENASHIYDTIKQLDI